MSVTHYLLFVSGFVLKVHCTYFGWVLPVVVCERFILFSDQYIILH